MSTPHAHAPAQCAALSGLCETINEAVQGFHSLLENELSLLNTIGRQDALAALSREKMALVERINHLELRRQQALKHLPDQHRSQAMREMLSAAGGDALKRWNETLDLLETCQQLNDRAGQQIRLQAGFTRRALEILTEDTAGGSIYAAGGGSRYEQAPRSLGSA